MSETQRDAFDGFHVMKPGGEKKLLGLLGLAARARRLVCGTDLCRDAVRQGRVLLVLAASDASPNTVKRITDACKYYHTDFCQVPVPSDILSSQIGKASSIAVIGVNDANFVSGITALFEK